MIVLWSGWSANILKKLQSRFENGRLNQAWRKRIERLPGWHKVI